MGIRKVRCGPEFIEKFLKGQILPSESTMPKDARCLGVQEEDRAGQLIIAFLFESEEFERTPEGQCIEDFQPIYSVKSEGA